VFSRGYLRVEAEILDPYHERELIDDKRVARMGR
jgi:hypothetical protein